MNRTIELDLIELMHTAKTLAIVNGHTLSNFDKRLSVGKARAWCLKCHADILVDAQSTPAIRGEVAEKGCGK